MRPEAGIVLSLFLVFGDFEPQCSYKIVLMNKECKKCSRYNQAGNDSDRSYGKLHRICCLVLGDCVGRQSNIINKS